MYIKSFFIGLEMDTKAAGKLISTKALQVVVINLEKMNRRCPFPQIQKENNLMVEILVHYIMISH